MDILLSDVVLTTVFLFCFGQENAAKQNTHNI